MTAEQQGQQTSGNRTPGNSQRVIVTVASVAGLVILAWRDPSLAPEVVTALISVVGFHHLSTR